MFSHETFTKANKCIKKQQCEGRGSGGRRKRGEAAGREEKAATNNSKDGKRITHTHLITSDINNNIEPILSYK